LTLAAPVVIAWREEFTMDTLVPDHLLDTKPATEIIDGRLVRKVSPWERHQELELRWVFALNAWAGERGKALHEWRHKFTAPGHAFASLVPDVAYVPRAVLDALGPKASQTPPRAPDAVVEILSRGDSQRNLAWKVGAYLAAGTQVVFVVDPPRRTVMAHDSEGTARFGPGDTAAHPSLPGFAYEVDAMFAGLYLGD
jgi:Uma2 family endonuclease